jgi:hypothetical protein
MFAPSATGVQARTSGGDETRAWGAAKDILIKLYLPAKINVHFES